MKKRRGLNQKLIVFFLVLVLSVLLLTGVSAYASQMSVYKEQSEARLQRTVMYLAELLRTDGNEFTGYQNLFLEVYDKVNIPVDFDGDYHPAKTRFYNKYNDLYPGKALGTEVDFSELSEELKILYVTYKHEYWLHIFETTRDRFDIAYTYYIVPTSEDLHMYYVLDAVREAREDDTNNINLSIDVYEPLEEHEHMWQAWNTGEFTPGFDIYDNDLGKTYACYYPLIINGQKIGVVCAEIEIETVNSTILLNAIRQVVLMALLTIFFGSILTMVIGRGYIKRLIDLKDDISLFTKTKDFSIADRISNDITGNDEINDLAIQTSLMISEMHSYTQSILDKNRKLTEAQEKIRSANELANKDSLTGIRNKTAYDNEVIRIESLIRNEGFSKFGIAMIDLNYLKNINDTYGHDKGNIAIKTICMLVCKNFSHSPIFRIGGDEFVAILENSDYDEADALVEKFRNTLSEIDTDDSLEPWEKVSAAIGYTMYDPASDTGVKSVFERADGLMYENKKAMKAARE